MPIYVYRCDKCNRTVETIQSTQHVAKSMTCDCGGLMERQSTAASVHFKGDGWTPRGNA